MFDKFSKNRSLEQARLTARRLISALGEANAQSIAIKLVEQYDRLDTRQRMAFFDFLASEFNPDPMQVLEIAQAYAADPSARNLIRLCQVSEPRRQELLRRINRAPRGTRAIIQMRKALLPLLKDYPSLAAIDADMHHLLSSWFNPGFLELHEITWDSPAQLLEKIIQHESVHAIDGWDDLRRRLQPDRRCFAFFHRQLPGEPLIFVEVALMNHIAESITPLLDESAAPDDLTRATTAIFYSISNTQTGLRGVSFGDSLIKHVVETLQAEFPRLKVFATLSPIPGLRSWLQRNAPAELLAAWERWDELGEHDTPRRALLGWAARYLTQEWADGKPLDPVARFHLGNGARVERLNWGADPSAKGVRQSYGLMVNYLYDLKRLDRHRNQLAQGRIPMSSEVEDLLKP